MRDDERSVEICNLWVKLFLFPHVFRRHVNGDQTKEKHGALVETKKQETILHLLYILSSTVTFPVSCATYDGVLSHSSSSPKQGPGATYIECRSKKGRGATEKTNIYKSTHMASRNVPTLTIYIYRNGRHQEMGQHLASVDISDCWKVLVVLLSAFASDFGYM